MKTLIVSVILLLLPWTSVQAAKTSEEAARIIEELQLRAGPVPVSAMKGWSPRKVLVTAPPVFQAGTGLPGDAARCSGGC